mgnify:CR=1 FL=1
MALIRSLPKAVKDRIKEAVARELDYDPARFTNAELYAAYFKIQTGVVPEEQCITPADWAEMKPWLAKNVKMVAPPDLETPQPVATTELSAWEKRLSAIEAAFNGIETTNGLENQIKLLNRRIGEVSNAVNLTQGQMSKKLTEIERVNDLNFKTIDGFAVRIMDLENLTARQAQIIAKLCKEFGIDEVAVEATEAKPTAKTQIKKVEPLPADDYEVGDEVNGNVLDTIPVFNPKAKTLTDTAVPRVQIVTLGLPGTYNNRLLQEFGSFADFDFMTAKSTPTQVERRVRNCTTFAYAGHVSIGSIVAAKRNSKEYHEIPSTKGVSSFIAEISKTLKEKGFPVAI